MSLKLIIISFIAFWKSSMKFDVVVEVDVDVDATAQLQTSLSRLLKSENRT